MLTLGPQKRARTSLRSAISAPATAARAHTSTATGAHTCTVARDETHRDGKPVKGERSNQSLWNYIRDLDDSLAWQIASVVVSWAVLLGLQVLIFEYLRPYRPVRGLSWSRRTNRKRS